MNHLLKLMLEDDKDIIRQECIAQIELNNYTIPFIVLKSLDRSTKVRVEVFKSLKNNTNVPFMQLDSADRLHLI
jgi:hypothetical protein